MNDLTPGPQVPPPHFASGYFRDRHAEAAAMQLGRGLVGHVPVVAWLLVGLGALEVGFALFCALFALVALALPPRAVGNSFAIAAMYGVMGIVCGACGVLRITAGMFNLRFRRRQLGLVALGVGLVTVFTGLCAPTAIGLGIYGLMVYFNDSVIAAFHLGSTGKSRLEIDAAFPPGS